VTAYARTIREIDTVMRRLAELFAESKKLLDHAEATPAKAPMPAPLPPPAIAPIAAPTPALPPTIATDFPTDLR
jgi:hypothetical protein